MIELRCLKTWSKKRSGRRFKGLIDAVLEEGQCRLKVDVAAQPRKDKMFPTFEDDCILSPPPEPCGPAPGVLPWPSMCVLIEVSVRLR